MWPLAMLAALVAGEAEGTGWVDFHGYRRCVKLENANCRVVLCHQSGGRVLEYSWKGVNAMALNPQAAGKVYDPVAGRGGAADGGRFDIGPEMIIPPHPLLWVGRWAVEITGPRRARLVSQKDPATGVQLVREFALEPDGSHLRCTQTITNVSSERRRWCHWGRTFAPGGGVVVVPVSRPSRFPNFYVVYGPKSTIRYRPEDPNIVLRGDFLVVKGPPSFPKLGMDSQVGWLAYQMKNDLVFVKRFRVYRDRPYNEMAALTVSIWYFKDELCELEPIGPANDLAPGDSASFTEDWWLIPHPFPKDVEAVDVSGLARLVAERAR